MEPEQPSTNKKVMIAFVLVLAVVIIAVGASVLAKKDDNDSAATGTTTSTATTPAAPSDSSTGSTQSDSGASSAATYRDGTYTASGTYSTPESQETIGVTLTIKDGVVTETSLDQQGKAAETKQYQARFASGYKQLVVGKKLSDIKLSRVSGSSLTSQGFNSAIQDIASQAKQS